MNIYILLSGTKAKGPLSLDQVKAMRNSGQVTDQTLCWWDGIPDWVPLTKLFSQKLALPSKTQVHPSGHLFDEMIQKPLIEGATTSSISKIVMGIESLRREDFKSAHDFFMSALTETHSVAGAWLGLACAEAADAPQNQQALTRLTHAMGKAAQHCNSEPLLLNCYLQILVFLVERGVALNEKALRERGELLNEAMQSAMVAQEATRAKNWSILWGTIGAVSALKSKGTFSKVLGYGLAGSQALQAVDSSQRAATSRNEANSAMLSAEAAYSRLLESSRAIAYALQEGRRISSRCQPLFQAKFAQSATSAWPVVAAFYKAELARLTEKLTPALRDLSKWKSNNSGPSCPPEITAAVALGDCFGVSNLPVQQNLKALAGDLRRIVQDTRLQTAESAALKVRKDRARKRLLWLICLLLGLGAAAAAGSFSLGINPWISVAAVEGVVLILWYCTQGTAKLLPIEEAIRQRVQNLEVALVASKNLDGEIKRLLV
jgi:hypothetical protein